MKDRMRGKFHFGCGPGVIYYHGAEGPIRVSEKNRKKIKKDMEEVLEDLTGCPRRLYQKAIDGLDGEEF